MRERERKRRDQSVVFSYFPRQKLNVALLFHSSTLLRYVLIVSICTWIYIFIRSRSDWKTGKSSALCRCGRKVDGWMAGGECMYINVHSVQRRSGEI